jgi:hypothetical protein
MRIIFLLFTFALQSQGPDQRELANRIREASSFERMEAVHEALELRSELRSPALREALADELSRINRLVEKRRIHPGVIEDDWDNLEIGSYLGELVQVNADSDDPISVEPLIGAIGTGNMAINAIVRHGGVVVGRLLPIIGQIDADPMSRAGAARALRLLFDRQQISDAHKRELSKILIAILNRPERFATVLSIVELASVAGDRTVVRRLQDISEKPDSANIVDASPEKLEFLRSRVDRALTEKSRK